MIYIILLTIIALMFVLNRLNSTKPECYLIEQTESCGYDYYNRNNDNCFEEIKLKQCCRGKDYMLKGVYGGLTCWYILNGQVLTNPPKSRGE